MYDMYRNISQDVYESWFQ